MLPDQSIQMLTAFVDGELSTHDREAVMRLLNQSSEAREMLRHLQENAHKLKSLPKRKVEPSLVNEILQAIAEQKVQPTTAGHPRRRRWRSYVAATMAASLLAGVVGIVVWKAIKEGNNGPNVDGPGFVQIDPKPEPKPDPTPLPKKANPLLADLTKMTDMIVRDFGAPVLTDTYFSGTFADLRTEGKSSAQLRHELSREKTVQLEVTVKKNSEAMARLRTVLEVQGIKLVTDPAAKIAVDDKKVEYFVYAENLTPEDFSKLMSGLSESYVVGNKTNQKNVSSPYQKVALAPLAKEEKQKVAKLLGVEPASLDRKETKSEGKSERVVVLLPSTSAAQPSAEVRQFVNQRRNAPPGAVQVLIKLRQE